MVLNSTRRLVFGVFTECSWGQEPIYVRVESASGIIYSNKFGEIGSNGYHYGIQIGNLVFDNMNLTGMKCEAWLIDLGVGEVADMTARYVTEILSH